MRDQCPDNFLFKNLPVPCVLVDITSNKVIKANSFFINKFLNSDQTLNDAINIKVLENFIKKNNIMNDLLNNRNIFNNIVSVDNVPTEYYLINAAPINENGQSQYMATIFDISDIERQKIKYEILLNKYQQIINMTQSAFVILDDKLIIQEANDVMGNLIGISGIELIGEKFTKLICEKAKEIKEKVILNFEEILNNQDGKIIRLDICFKKKDNTKLWMSLNAACFGENKIVGFLYDISSKKNEEHLKFINIEKNKDKIKQKLSILQKELSVIKNKKSIYE